MWDGMGVVRVNPGGEPLMASKTPSDEMALTNESCIRHICTIPLVSMGFVKKSMNKCWQERPLKPS